MRLHIFGFPVATHFERGRKHRHGRQRFRPVSGAENLEQRCLMAYLYALNPDTLVGSETTFTQGGPTHSYGMSVNSGNLSPQSQLSDTEGTLGAPLQLQLMPGPDETNGELRNVVLQSQYGASSWSIGNAQSDFSILETVSFSGQSTALVSVRRQLENYVFNDSTTTTLEIPIGTILSLTATVSTMAFGPLTGPVLVESRIAASLDVSTAIQSVTASPTLVTAASPGVVTLGDSDATTLSDVAVLSGGQSETGNITFTLRGPGGFFYSETDPVSGDGRYSASTSLPTSAL